MKAAARKSKPQAQPEKPSYGIGMTVSACLWLGLFPLLQGLTYSTITYDKWICMYILAGLTAAGFVVDVVMRRVSRPRWLPLILCGAFALWTLISCLASPYAGSPWWIGTGRRDGLASQLCYWGLFVLFTFSRVKKEPVILIAGISIFIYLGIVMSQRAMGNPLGLYPVGFSFASAPGFQGPIGNVDMAVGYLLILCGLFTHALIEAIREYNFWFRDMVLRFLAADLYLILSMEVQFGLLTVAVLLVIILIRFLPKKLRVPVLLALLLVAALVVWLVPVGSGPLHELHEVMNGNADPAFGSGRVGVWIYCFDVLHEEGRLFLGTGADTFALRFNEWLNTYYENHPDAERFDVYYDNPHNEYIALLMNCGIPALLFFLALVIGGCFGQPAWRDGVLCYGIQALLSFSVCIVAPMFWAVLGMAWKKPGRTDPDSKLIRKV